MLHVESGGSSSGGKFIRGTSSLRNGRRSRGRGSAMEGSDTHASRSRAVHLLVPELTAEVARTSKTHPKSSATSASSTVSAIWM